MKQLFRFLTALGISLLITSCKLAVIVLEGGEVQSDASGTCVGGNICIVEVENSNFGDTFTAVADEDWYFHKWSSGEGFLCGDSALPQCELNYDGIDDKTIIEKIVASSEVFYLMPVFKDYPRVSLGDYSRITTTGGVNQLWLQPADFTDYSYDQVAAACPDGVCSGTLPGSPEDLTGHIWASSEDIELLFLAHYQGGRAVTDEFELTTKLGDRSVSGILRDRPKGPDKLVKCAIANRSGGVEYYYIDYQHPLCQFARGFWFYRPLD